MRILIIAIILLIVLSSISCQKDFSPLSLNNDKVIDLQIGNQFYYAFVSSTVDTTGIASVAEYSGIYKVNQDTLIHNQFYYIFNNTEIKRVDEKRLYVWNGIEEKIELEYNTHVGDTVEFLGRIAIIKEIKEVLLFGEIQKSYKVSSKSIYVNSKIEGTYATKFGLLNMSYREQTQNGGYSVVTQFLVGAKLSNHNYGILP